VGHYTPTVEDLMKFIRDTGEKYFYFEVTRISERPTPHSGFEKVYNEFEVVTNFESYGRFMEAIETLAFEEGIGEQEAADHGLTIERTQGDFSRKREVLIYRPKKITYANKN